MRIDRVWLESFKNLRNFEVHLDTTASVEVLVGRNGTGKSNLLEALVIIFRDLDLHPTRPTLKYRLGYMCNEHHVSIDADPGRSRNKLKVRVDGADVATSALSSDGLLPRFLFGYYSGTGDRFEEHFRQHQNRFYRSLLADEDIPLRSLFYARPFHSQFVLLAFFLDPDPQLAGFVDSFLGVTEIEDISIVLQQPSWATKDNADDLWGARGTPRPLMEQLIQASDPPIRERVNEDVDFRRTRHRTHIRLHYRNLDQLRPVYANYSSRQDFFKALESLIISDLLSEMSVRMRRRSQSEAVEYRQLSEGEQQLLMVLGLLRFTQEDQSLLLLDEPDTHLNPTWSLWYTELLESVMGAMDTSQVIMATHDPLVIAGLHSHQVVLFEAKSEGGVSTRHPEKDPRGMGVAALLTSEVYGLRSQLDLPTLTLLDEKRLLASKEERSHSENMRLRELETVVSDVDFAATVRDPLYKVFVEAMAIREEEDGLVSPVLSHEELRRRSELIREVVEELDGSDTSAPL